MNKHEELFIKHEPLSSLIPHPENTKYFRDMDGEAWEVFLEDVRENGITEPLTIDEATRHIIKGNQRYRAASVLRMETVPCIVRPYADEQEAIDDLIRDNAMRRDMGLLEKYKLVGHLKKRLDDRRAANGNKGGENAGGLGGLAPRDQICQILGLHPQDISAAMAIESLSPSEKEEFYEAINKSNPSKKNIYEQIKVLKGRNKALSDESSDLKKELKEQKERIKDLEHLEEKRIEINKQKDILETWNENDPEIFASAQYFNDGLDYTRKIVEFMSENLAFLKNMPISKEAAEALSENMKQVIGTLDEYRDSLFQKYIAILD